MVRILSLVRNEGYYGIWYDDGSYYVSALLFFKIGVVEELSRTPKNEYKNYEHFVGVMGKFVPLLSLLIDPILADEISKEEMDRVFTLLPK